MMRFRVVVLSLGVCFAGQAAHCLSLESIRERLLAQPVLDTVNMQFTTSVSGMGYSAQMQSHVITKGETKVWMEMETPMGRQRLVRNGNRFQTTDLRTGKVENPIKAPESLTSLPNPGQGTNLLSQGTYASPVSLGNGRYRVDAVTIPDTTVKARSLIYDTGLGQLVQIQETSKAGDTTLTDLEFDATASAPVPKKIRMVIKGKDGSTALTIAFHSFTRPSGVSEKLFEIRPQ